MELNNSAMHICCIFSVFGFVGIHFNIYWFRSAIKCPFFFFSGTNGNLIQNWKLHPIILNNESDYVKMKSSYSQNKIELEGKAVQIYSLCKISNPGFGIRT